MSYTKKIVCLANSLKSGGRCVAGREIEAGGLGGWIRPVSMRPAAELSLLECRYQDESWPRLLDVLEIQLKKPSPHHHQTENHVIDKSQFWIKAGEFAWNELETLVEHPSTLWPNGEQTYHGKNDVVEQVIACSLGNSLVLVKPEAIAIRVGKEGAAEFPRKTRAIFQYGGVEYRLKVTDPVAEEVFQVRGDGEYPLTDVYLCVSLTEPYEKDGRCYKIVAGIVSRRPL